MLEWSSQLRDKSRNRTLVFSLEVGKLLKCFQKPFRHFAAVWSIEITSEFLFVGIAAGLTSSVGRSASVICKQHFIWTA